MMSSSLSRVLANVSIDTFIPDVLSRPFHNTRANRQGKGGASARHSHFLTVPAPPESNNLHAAWTSGII